MLKRIISYGKRYEATTVKVKISKVKIFKILFVFLVIVEIVLGVLWACGY